MESRSDARKKSCEHNGADVTLRLAAHRLMIDKYYQLAIFPASSLSPGTSSTASPHTAASSSYNRIDTI